MCHTALGRFLRPSMSSYEMKKKKMLFLFRFNKSNSH
jgi:hypothetical protein